MPAFGGVDRTGSLLPGLTVDGLTEAVDCNSAVKPGAGFLTSGAQQVPHVRQAVWAHFRNFSILCCNSRLSEDLFSWTRQGVHSES